MIPASKILAVRRALQSAFGVTEFESIRQLTTGLSTALVFQLIVKGNPYLLRIITRTDALSDPTDEYACMQSGANAGIAPHIWYTSITDKIAITDFIEAKPFPPSKAIQLIPELLSQLHRLPGFPYRVNYLDKMGTFIQKFQEAEYFPESMIRDLFNAYLQIRNVYPYTQTDLVACHNDLKPENMLFDGNKLWLIDWEAAFLNDRFVDLSVPANFVVRSDADEKSYLKSYFGQEATDYQLACFFLMRQAMHLFYFVSFTLFSKASDKPSLFNKPQFSFRSFHDLIWAGAISLASSDTRLQYALIHRDQLQQNLQLNRFADSLAIVGNHHY